MVRPLADEAPVAVRLLDRLHAGGRLSRAGRRRLRAVGRRFVAAVDREHEPVTVTCRHCGATVTVSPSQALAGVTTTCPGCGDEMHIRGTLPGGGA